MSGSSVDYDKGLLRAWPLPGADGNTVHFKLIAQSEGPRRQAHHSPLHSIKKRTEQKGAVLAQGHKAKEEAVLEHNGRDPKAGGSVVP